MVSALSLGSSKRTRALNSGNQIVSCLVDGCVSDLSKCREYHRRHKVCEAHSKTAIVMVGGREQRFCQQCSRFHLLVEFDEVKRSCRKRLEGHNRRRRKPQLHSINYGAFKMNYQGTRFTSFPQILSTPAAKSNWPHMKAENVPISMAYTSPQYLINDFDNYDHFPVSSRGIFKDVKKLPFLQGTVHEPLASACQPLLSTVSDSSSWNSSSSSISSGKLFNADRALSLLSSPMARSSHVNLAQEAANRDRIPMAQSLIPAMGCNSVAWCYDSEASGSVSPTGFSFSGIQHEHGGTVLVTDSTNAKLQSHGLLHVRSGGLLEAAPQGLPFSWQ